MKDLQWFLDREFSSVVRHNKKDNTISQVDITSEKVAKYLFDLQSNGFTFSPVLRVHKAPPGECESCSA